MKIKALLKSKIKNKKENKRGSELTEAVLVSAVMMVLIATLFYPQIQTLTASAMTKMNNWFGMVLGQL